MSDYSIRALAPGDEDRIIDLFKIVFGATMTMPKWHWQFRANPFSRPIVYVATTADDQMVGHYSLIPLPFDLDGRKTLAALSIQSMIHPDHQKRGILKKLASAAEKQLDDDGVEVGITFLNDNSLHAYKTHFGWTELEGPNFIYFTVLSTEGIFEKVLRNRPIARALAFAADPVARVVFSRRFSRRSAGAASGVSVKSVARFDERVDSLWERFSRGMGRAVPRTARYLNWRTVENPASYQRIVAEQNGELIGLAVTKVDLRFGLKFGYVAELIFNPDRPDVGELLIAHALRTLRVAGCSMASAATAGSPTVLSVLRGSGFQRLPRKAMPHGIHFCFKHRAAESGEEKAEEKRAEGRRPDAGGWFLSWLDHDVV